MIIALLFLLFSTNARGEELSESLTTLQHSLTHIATHLQKKPKKQAFLISSLLTTNPTMFVTHEALSKTYQLRLDPQPFYRDATCVFRTVRASFFTTYGATFDNPIKELATWYTNPLLNPINAFKPIYNVQHTHYFPYKDVANILLYNTEILTSTCQHNHTCIISPVTDKTIIDKLCICYSYDPRRVLGPGHTPTEQEQQLFQDRIDRITQVIMTHEQKEKSDANPLAIQASLMYISQYDRMVPLLDAYHAATDYAFCILSSTSLFEIKEDNS